MPAGLYVRSAGRRNKILAVGNNAAIEKLASPTGRIDLGGYYSVRLHDAHYHTSAVPGQALGFSLSTDGLSCRQCWPTQSACSLRRRYRRNWIHAILGPGTINDTPPHRFALTSGPDIGRLALFGSRIVFNTAA
jgi:hypothetical protein